MRKIKAIILSVIDFTDSRNGGGLWGASLLRSMAQLQDADVTIVSAGPMHTQTLNEQAITGLGLAHAFVPFRPQRALSGDTLSRFAAPLRSLLRLVLQKYYFPWEQEALRQKHVDKAFMEILQRVEPDVVVINYLFTALFVPSLFASTTPRVLITLNDEAAFQRMLSSSGGPTGDGLRQRLARALYRCGNGLVNRRVRQFERHVYEGCRGAVALTSSDLPGDLPAGFLKAVLPPILPQGRQLWSYRATRSVFFVGNIGYYPNRMSVEWLCCRLSPALAQIDPGLRIVIIGAAADQVPPQWRAPNVNFLGYSNREEVLRQMTTADLFVAPIANSFGAKLKLAECVSFGMPFAATAAALSGLPFLTAIPLLDLEQPQAAARLVADYIADPEKLMGLSRSVLEQASQARERQPDEWSSFLRRASATGGPGNT